MAASNLLVWPRFHVRHNLRLGHDLVDQRHEEREAVCDRGGDAVHGAASDPVKAGDNGDVADRELHEGNQNAQQEK